METTKIQWAESTVNFWMGCKKVSIGCRNCYSERIMSRGNSNFETVRRVSNKKFYEALEWKEPKLVFTCSMSDFFIQDADSMRQDAWRVIKNTPQHTWQILTKRPERIPECLPPDWGNGYKNVWLGTSIANESEKHRLMELQKQKTNASGFLTFLSVEPLIGNIDFESDPVVHSAFKKLDWVIIGGESGNDYGKFRYRECRLEWIEHIMQQCKSAGIPVFVKQMGTHLAKQMGLNDSYYGGDMNEWPERLKVRNFPISSNQNQLI